MIRILQSVNIMDRAGLETMLMNYYRHMDRDVVQFDFLTHRVDKGAYDDEILSMGGNVYHAPRLLMFNSPEYSRYMRMLFRDHPEYRIIHSHIDAMSYFPLLAGKRNGIPVRIAHSHSSELENDFKKPVKYFCLKHITDVATHNCACGHRAGQFMFGDRPFRLINNAIDLDSYGFSEETRMRKRLELGLEGKFVVGHVGRYCYIKNQLFLIDVFNAIIRKRPDSHLLLVGKGEDLEKIKKKVNELGIGNKVSLLIDRSDVNELYQAMDVFVMPSLFEGLPLVAVEAQASGLRCVASDKISSEINLSSSIEQLSLDLGSEKWADHILGLDVTRNKNARKELSQNGYDIRLEALKLQQWYCDLNETVLRGKTI